MSDPLHPETGQPLLSDVNRALRDHWLTLRGEGPDLPSWDAFDPVAVPRLLPYLVVVEVVGDPAVFRYRLVGTFVTELAGRDATGRTLDAALYGDRLEAMIWTFRKCAETGVPLATLGSVHFAEKEWVTAEHIFLPFARGPDGDSAGIVLSGLDVLAGDQRLAGRARDVELILDWRK
ncbi:MAG: hypothetical protein TEF_15120 [Rhizobiales bacterium NRL2]|jgi:hypothetical protein|nr:MAG: hypothetical protein TEF_15120 [Rhizobiales bacterium NRL2]